MGQDLIAAANIRAQISQIEKYQTAVNTFRIKYGYLPGDIPEPAASSFGFVARGVDAWGTLQGNGNGIIVGQGGWGWNGGAGEVFLFWRDLSAAQLIDGGFNIATPTTTPATVPEAFPAAKIGRGNYVYAWNYGTNASPGINYFSISVVTNLNWSAQLVSTAGLTVQQAYAMDNKLDDGKPLTGRILAWYVPGGVIWAGVSPAGTNSNLGNIAASGSSGSCYDNAGNASTPVAYSTAQNNGTGVNCALSFKF